MMKHENYVAESYNYFKLFVILYKYVILITLKCLILKFYYIFISSIMQLMLKNSLDIKDSLSRASAVNHLTILHSMDTWKTFLTPNLRLYFLSFR